MPKKKSTSPPTPPLPSGTHQLPSAQLPEGLDLEALPRLSMDELRPLWARHMGRARCPVQKRVLVRELAWRVQERIYGGLDPETSRLLEAAVRAALKRRKGAKAVDASVEDDQLPKRKPPARAAHAGPSGKLPTGARLIRVWPPGGGVKHEVTVLDGGKRFEYRGKEYQSLSEVARVITGTRWSGPRFFGLSSKRVDRQGGVE